MVTRVAVSEPLQLDDSGVQTESLDSLMARATGIETGASTPGAPPAGAVAGSEPDPVAEAAEVVELAWSLLGPFLPERIAERYGDAQRATIAKTYAAVAQKRGWDIAETLGRWGPEIALAAALAGPVLPVVVADIKARRAAAQAAADANQVQAQATA